MITHEQRHYAETLRNMLVQGYMSKGDAWGHALAARCAWVIGEVVSDVHGRAGAVAMLDATSDAINAKAETTPVPEFGGRQGAAGLDSTTLPGRWIMPAPKSEQEMEWVLDMIEAAFHLQQAKASRDTVEVIYGAKP